MNHRSRPCYSAGMPLPSKQRAAATEAIRAGIEKAGGAVTLGVVIASAALLIAAVALIVAAKAHSHG